MCAPSLSAGRLSGRRAGRVLHRPLSRAANRARSSRRLRREADAGWARILDADWSLDAARAAIDSCASSGCHWLDRGEEHPHRLALSVPADEAAALACAVVDAVEGRGFRAQAILSGIGDRRYLDVLSVHGGKRSAMDYVRRVFAVARDRVVAAGDSGNDVLMLDGDGPGVVVGNAQPALVEWATERDQRQARGRVVLTEAPLARGVLEGLARHGFF